VPQRSCCLNNAPTKHMRDDYLAACICQFFPFIPDTYKHEVSGQTYKCPHKTTISRSQRRWVVKPRELRQVLLSTDQLLLQSTYSGISRNVKHYKGRGLEGLATFLSIIIATISLLTSILELYYFRAPKHSPRVHTCLHRILRIQCKYLDCSDQGHHLRGLFNRFCFGNLGDTNNGALSGFLAGNSLDGTIVLIGTFG